MSSYYKIGYTIAFGIVLLRLLWVILSKIEEVLLSISNTVITTLTPMGISLLLSIIVFFLSIKHIKLTVHLIGSFFTTSPSKQKQIAIPLFTVFVITVFYIKGINADSYAKNVKDFYKKSNNFVEKTSIFTYNQNLR